MLEFVHPSKLSAGDVALLQHADSISPNYVRIAPAELIAGIWDGRFLLYRCPQGVFLLEVVDCRLNIVRMAGNRLAQCFQKIAVELQHIARNLGCVAIETNVYSSKLAKALTRAGAKQESVVMVLELENG